MAWPDYNDLTDAQASSAFQSAASANSLKIANLSALGQLQLACANLLLGDAPVGDIPAGEIAAGTFGSSSSTPTGNYGFPNVLFSTTAITTPSALAATAFNAFASAASGGVVMGFGTTHDVALKNRAGTTVFGVVANSTQIDLVAAAAGVRGGATSTTFYRSDGSTIVLQYDSSGRIGIGTAAATRYGIDFALAQTATSGRAWSFVLEGGLTAAANSDTLRGLYIGQSVTPGAFTALQYTALEIAAFSTAAYTSPGNPVGIGIGVITGTGASVATAIQIAPPTGASTNYLIAHTTAATFNVTAAGLLTSASNSVWKGGTAVPATAGAVAAGAPITLYSGGITIEVTSDAPTHTRPKGSLCINTGGGSGSTRMYINTDGAGTWTNFTTAG